jgi:tripartite-type tricarboxylate transporter receptor subunit TctC
VLVTIARGVIAVIAALLVVVLSAQAQDWPAKPLTIVVAFPAGGSDDILGRIVAAGLANVLRQPVSVENVSGAGGMTGTARVAKAPSDGYQLALGTSATHAISQVARKQPLYDSLQDFSPVALIAEQPFVLIARKDITAGGLREFIAYAETDGRELRYGSAGTGSATHLVCARIAVAIGAKATHVAYNGGVPALRDLIDGRIDYFCPVVTIAIPEIEKATVNAIAILSAGRTPVLPGLASAAEQGHAGLSASTWFALFVPAATPEALVARLNAAVMTVLEGPAVQAQLREIGAEIVAPERRSPGYLRSFLKGEIEKWSGAIKAADVIPD